MIGVVLAGGASRRFEGRAKGLWHFRGRAMALCVADILGQFCSRVVIEAVAGAGFETLGLPLAHAPMEHAGKGPLAGLAAGLGVADAGERVAFAACDMPLLTRGVYDTLALAGDPGAYARTDCGEEPLVSILSVGMRPALFSALEASIVPRTQAVLDAAGAVTVHFADSALFAIVNTPEDLARFGAP